MSNLVQKWGPILDHPDFAPIKDSYRKHVTAVLLENQEKALQEERGQGYLNEAHTNIAGNVQNFDPVLISLVRRTAPNLMAYDTMGVQPLTLPTGLIFAMKSKYGTGATGPLSSTEALFNEANTGWGGTGTHDADVVGNITASGATGLSAYGGFGTGITLATAEGAAPNTMGFTIDRVTATAVTRQLAADYSLELAQDLKNVHNLDADSEISNILSAELMAEMNRESTRTIYKVAKYGAQANTTNAGGFDLDSDSDGRWSVERFKGLVFQAEREANQIAKGTRRGKGNFLICSSDVASALAMAGKLDYAPAMSTDLAVDDTGNTFAGTLNGKYKVFIDPYFSSGSSVYTDIMVVGYKGSNAYDAGLFYCPYVPLTMVRAVDPLTFQPRIGFKTRYAIVSNPLGGDGATLGAQSNAYYRKVLISNLL